jgi:glycosyltransferase involved in cell wall biosynthesis
MAGIERRVLRNCSAILVQTAADRAWLAEIGGPELEARTVVCPNGVPDALLNQPLPSSIPHPRLLLAVSSFQEPLYRQNLERFLEDTWGEIKRAVPEARLRITGKGLQEHGQLYSQLHADPQIELAGFVADIRDVYTDVRLVLAPIYKSYGYINKVAEAFAAGLPVLGDKSAFNGLEASVTLGCGRAASNAAEFSEEAIRYLSDDALWREASMSARRYAQETLTWQSRMPVLQRAVGQR